MYKESCFDLSKNPLKKKCYRSSFPLNKMVWTAITQRGDKPQSINCDDTANSTKHYDIFNNFLHEPVHDLYANGSSFQ